MPTIDSIAAGGPRPAFVTAAPFRARARRAWFAPDLALTGALAALVYLLAVFGGPSALFRDADSGWHIRAGERMIATWAPIHTDPFSFSKPDAPWIAWEWGSDVLAGAAHIAAGLSGVAWLYMVAIAASVWMWFRLNWATGGNFAFACLFAAPMLSAANLHWLARPHVFGWLFAIATVWYCERTPTLSLWAVFGLSAVWANVHASFLLGTTIMLIYGVGFIGRRVLWGCGAGRARLLFGAAGVALAGSFVNPHGWNLHRHVLSYLSDSALIDRIGEFQSFNFHADGAAEIVLALILGLAGGCAALAGQRLDRFLLSILLTAAALRSARMIPVAALLLLPLANGSISSVLTNAELAPRARRALDRILDYGLNLRALDRGMGGAAIVPVALIALFGVTRAMRPEFPPDQFPVQASGAIAKLPGDARIFSSDKFGGYLIYRFGAARKVYFDGRSDFYGADFLKVYARMVQARPGWEADFARGRFTNALIPPDSALGAALEARGWKELYRDRTAVLLGGPKG